MVMVFDSYILTVQILSGFTVFMGGFHLWQWFFGDFALQGLTAITMKTNTAFCFLLLGITIALHVSLVRKAIVLNVVRLISGIVLAIGFLTLVENIFKFEFGIDNLLAREPPGALGVIHPNRMGIPASLSFTLAGTALLFSTSSRFKIIYVQILGSIVVLIGLTGLLGYLFNAKVMFGMASFTAIALPSAILLICVGISIILIKPYEGMMKEFTTTDTGRQLILKFFIPAVFFAILTGFLRLQGDHLGLYDFATGTALRTLFFILIIGGILYLNAKELNARISSQYLAQNALKQKEKELQEAQQLAHIGSWYMDAKTRKVSVSPEVFFIKGLPAQDSYPSFLPDNKALYHYTDQSWEKVKVAVENALQNGVSYELDLESRKADGTVQWITNRGEAVYDEQRNIIGLRGTIQDVTQRKKDEETLRFLVDLNTATQSLTHPDAIMAVTACMLGEHLNVNRCAYAQIEENGKIFVITGDYPKSVPTIKGRWPVAAFGAECQRIMLANQPFIVSDTDQDPRITKKDLAAYRATAIRAVICVPLHKAGKFTAAMAVHQKFPRQWTPEEIELVSLVVSRCWESLERASTIQSLEESEQSLRLLTEALEARVKDRTKSLEDQTERLRKLAVELTQVEQKERRRLAEVLHDHLQQYLVAAKMRLDLLEKKAVSLDKKGLDEARSYIEQAADSSRQLTADLRPPVLYEGGLAAGLRFLAQKMEDQHKIYTHLLISSDIEPGSDLIKVLIYQCVQELIFNAVKYAKVSECFVTVERLDGVIQVIVEDKGIGFNLANLGMHDKGGFGLFSIRERIKALGGDLKISSILSQGSIFTLTVPDEIRAGEKKIDIFHEKSFARERSAKEGMLVLVVDDHPIIRQSIASLLKSQSFIREVIEAANGEEAIQKAEIADPDIILMDVNMPIMNGIEATKILSKRHLRCKIIGLSVQAESEMSQAMKDAGASGYFNKGDDTASLIQAIKSFSIL